MQTPLDKVVKITSKKSVVRHDNARGSSELPQYMSETRYLEIYEGIVFQLLCASSEL